MTSAAWQILQVVSLLKVMPSDSRKIFKLEKYKVVSAIVIFLHFLCYCASLQDAINK